MGRQEGEAVGSVLSTPSNRPIVCGPAAMVLDRSRTSPQNSPVRKSPSLKKAPSPRSDFIEATGPVGFEKWLIDSLCKPVLEWTPACVSPNAISMANFCVTLTILILSIQRSPSPEMQLFYSVCCGVGMVISMILDCLDGMQARKTDQCSKLGEVLDHALDAVSVPISVASVGFGAGMFATGVRLPMATGMVLSTTVYNAQLILYHHTGKFLHSDITTGTEGQFALGLTHVGFGLWEYILVKMELPLQTHTYGTWAYCLISVLATIRVLWFYIEKLIPLGVWQPYFIYNCIDSVALAVLVAILSFRVNGTFVIKTCVKESFDGVDLVCILWTSACLLDLFGQISLDKLFKGTVLAQAKSQALVAGLCVYIVARNLFILSQHYSRLKPQPKKMS